MEGEAKASPLSDYNILAFFIQYRRLTMDIKEIREITGLNQTEFAKKYDIPLRTYQHWENGDRNPPQYVLTMLHRLAELDTDNDQRTE